MAGNGCQQGFRSVTNFDFGGQKRAPKPPQAICKPLPFIEQPTLKQLRILKDHLI